MEYHQITLNEWIEQKEALRRELGNVRESFVRVGYILRKMEESKAYEAEGYRSVAEFAEKEHGLKPSTTSRWMSINREYSLNGYSMTLDPKYLEMNASQLTEMLGLPDSDRELITPATQREDIRELKRFNRESGQNGTPDSAGGTKEVLFMYLEKNPGVAEEVSACITSGNAEPKHLAEIVAPAGSAAFRAGPKFVFFSADHIKVKTFGSDEKETVTWEGFAQAAAEWIMEHGVREETQEGDPAYGRQGDAEADGSGGDVAGTAGSDSGYVREGGTQEDIHISTEEVHKTPAFEDGNTENEAETTGNEAESAGKVPESTVPETGPADQAEKAEPEGTDGCMNEPVEIAPAQFGREKSEKEVIVEEDGTVSEPEEAPLDKAIGKAWKLVYEIEEEMTARNWKRCEARALELRNLLFDIRMYDR